MESITKKQIHNLSEIVKSMTPDNFEEKLALIKSNFPLSINEDMEMTMRAGVFPRAKFKEEKLIFEGGLAPAKKNGKCGYINYNFEVVIPFDYDFCGRFFEASDTAIIGIGEKYGVIDNTKKIIVDIIYDHIGSYGFGWSEYTEVMLNGKLGVVDKNGHASPIIYDRIDWEFENNSDFSKSCIRKNPVGVILKNKRVSKKEALLPLLK